METSLTKSPAPSGERRYAIVTGANRPSIGFRAAQLLAGEPYRYRVVLACRDGEKGRAAVSEIVAADPSAIVFFLHLDLAYLESVRAFPQAFQDLDDDPGKSLSVLINNAGIGWGQTKDRWLTSAGFEMRFGVNHLGHFLLTNLLLPSLKAASPPGRIVIVSSSLHIPPAKKGASAASGAVSLDFDDLQLADMEPFDPAFAYRRSKLCNVLFAYALQRRLWAEGSGVTVNAMSPGFIPSAGLVRDAGPVAIFFLRYILDYMCCCRVTRSIDDGAWCEVMCAVDPKAQPGGKYFELTREGVLQDVSSSDESYDIEQQQRLWEISAELTGFSS